MNKVDMLLKKAKKIAGEWKPFLYCISETSGGKFRVFRTLWNGIAGTLCPGSIEVRGINPYRESEFESRDAAERCVEADAVAHSLRIYTKPQIYNLCLPETDAEKKAVWKKQGGTVMERLAEKAGLSLEKYIRREYGPPFESEQFMLDRLNWYSDIIRWRREDGLDAEKASETIDPEGG